MALSFEKLEAVDPGLAKLARKAQFSLSKHGVDGQPAKVALCLDHSGSMRRAYDSGQMQALAERLLALATQLDDDGSIDVFFFGTQAWHGGEVEVGSHVGAIDRMREGQRLGKTNYAEAITSVREHFGMTGSSGGASALPIYVLFLTDGAPTSRPAAETELRAAAGFPIFWKFLSIGTEEIAFLTKLDDLADRPVDNADYQPIGDLDGLSDQALFDVLLMEYREWLVAARAAGQLS